MMKKLRKELPTKQEAWRYVKTHYGSLYFYGFGGFCLLVSVVAGVLVSNGKITFQPGFTNLMLFVCFGWVAWSVFSQTADRMHKEESAKAQTFTQQKKQEEAKTNAK